jgi:hypothetical protein
VQGGEVKRGRPKSRGPKNKRFQITLPDQIARRLRKRGGGSLSRGIAIELGDENVSDPVELGVHAYPRSVVDAVKSLHLVNLNIHGELLALNERLNAMVRNEH